jgi:hypothetical protein
MEKNQPLSPWIASVIGLAIGAVVTFFVLKTNPQMLMISKPCPQTLTEKQVGTYMKNYRSTATAFQDTLKGFNVDIRQFYAMSCLFDKNPQLAGFRVYLGKDAAGSNTSMIVGLDINGQDVRTLLYGTTFKYSGPCPPICDANVYLE